MHIIGTNGKPLTRNDSCTINIDGKTQKFKEFIVIGVDKEKISIAHNVDAIILGIGVQVIRDHFKENYESLNDNDKEVVDNFFRRIPDEQN